MTETSSPIQLPPPGQPFKWDRLSADDAHEQWHRLRAWVHWWVRTYGVAPSVIGPCWYKHARIVEEVSALERAHEAFFDSAAPGSSPVMWHREMELCLSRLRAHMNNLGCSLASHHNERPVEWPAGRNYLDASTEWFDADVDDREEAAQQAAIAAVTGVEDPTGVTK